MLKCVPLHPAWVGNESRLDLKAIYARRKQDNWGVPILDADGREQWDTTGPLPLRRHHKWVEKGFQYITLADFDSLQQAAAYLDEDWRSYIADRRTRSPFSLDLWLAQRAQQQQAELDDLRGLVAKFGAEAVTAIKRQTNPAWTMPAAALTEDPVKRGPGRPRKDVPEGAVA